MKCGHCKASHQHVSEVRECANGYGVQVAVGQSHPHPSQPGFVPKNQIPDVPTGRYAVEMGGVLGFYKVDKPTEGRWGGYTFLKQYASDETFPVKNYSKKEYVLNKIAEDPEAAMLRYGKEIGRCGHCGRTLTDEISRAYGIGPVCRNKIQF